MRYALVLMLACAACGTKTGDSTSDPNNKAGDSNNSVDSNNKTNVYAGTDITGVVITTQLSGMAPDMNNIVIYAQDAISGAPLKTTDGNAVSTPLDASKCAATGCPFSLKAVDLSKQAYGLQIVTVDTRATGGVWAPVMTGSAPQTAVAAAIGAKSAIGPVSAFAMDANALGALSAGSGVAAATLLKGSVVGLALSTKLSPVADVTAAVPASASLAYANFTNGTTPAPGGTHTDATGLFVITPMSGQTVQGATVTLTAAHGETFPTYPVSVYTNEIFVLPYVSTTASTANTTF